MRLMNFTITIAHEWNGLLHPRGCGEISTENVPVELGDPPSRDAIDEVALAVGLNSLCQSWALAPMK